MQGSVSCSLCAQPSFTVGVGRHWAVEPLPRLNHRKLSCFLGHDRRKFDTFRPCFPDLFEHLRYCRAGFESELMPSARKEEL